MRAQCAENPVRRSEHTHKIGVKVLGYRENREMTKVICSDCGKEAEVPFKPTEGRPVYCRECFAKHRSPRF